MKIGSNATIEDFQKMAQMGQNSNIKMPENLKGAAMIEIVDGENEYHFGVYKDGQGLQGAELRQSLYEALTKQHLSRKFLDYAHTYLKLDEGQDAWMPLTDREILSVVNSVKYGVMLKEKTVDGKKVHIFADVYDKERIEHEIDGGWTVIADDEEIRQGRLMPRATIEEKLNSVSFNVALEKIRHGVTDQNKFKGIVEAVKCLLDAIRLAEPKHYRESLFVRRLLMSKIRSNRNNPVRAFLIALDNLDDKMKMKLLPQIRAMCTDKTGELSESGTQAAFDAIMDMLQQCLGSVIAVADIESDAVRPSFEAAVEKIISGCSAEGPDEDGTASFGVREGLRTFASLMREAFKTVDSNRGTDSQFIRATFKSLVAGNADNLVKAFFGKLDKLSEKAKERCRETLIALREEVASGELAKSETTATVSILNVLQERLAQVRQSYEVLTDKLGEGAVDMDLELDQEFDFKKEIVRGDLGDIGDIL